MSAKSKKKSGRGSLLEQIMNSDMSQAAKQKKLDRIMWKPYATGHSPNGFPFHFEGPGKYGKQEKTKWVAPVFTKLRGRSHARTRNP